MEPELIVPLPEATIRSRSDMTEQPTSSSTANGGRVLVSLGRADTALYAPLRDWMVNSNVIDEALKVGDDAPDFFLPDDQARLIALRALLQQGPVVLAFLGGGWCSFCVAKLKALAAALAARGGPPVSLVAVTPETGPYPRQMRATHQLDCTVLSDVDYGVGLLFGVISVVPPGIVTEMAARGVDLGALHGVTKPMLAAPAVYVIAPSGKIVMATLDRDFTTSADTVGLVAALDRLN
jgi:peroxiredoxin